MKLIDADTIIQKFFEKYDEYERFENINDFIEGKMNGILWCASVISAAENINKEESKEV